MKIPKASPAAYQILQYECRWDENGNPKVYELPSNDGGGTHEICGINSKYHRKQVIKMMAARPEEREDMAAEYIENYYKTNMKLQADDPGVELFLMDTCFNRGPSGCTRIIQMAIARMDYHVIVDGILGPQTRGLLKRSIDQDPVEFLVRLRGARETYERNRVGVRKNLWDGLVNRWDMVLTDSIKFKIADQVV